MESKKEEVIKFWKSGKTRQEIKEMLGISLKTISIYLNSDREYRQIKDRERIARECLYEEIFEIWRSQSKKNISKIARIFNLSRQRTQQILGRYKEYRDYGD
jgi:DNA-binding CsgD family transcriptional regulator